MDEFDFDDNFEDDDFDFEDDFDTEDEFSFEADNDDFDFGDDDALGTDDSLDFGDNDFDFGDEELEDFDFNGDDDRVTVPAGGQVAGTNRTFLFLAGALIVLFIIGLIAVLALAGGGLSEFEVAATGTTQGNMTLVAQITETNVAALATGEAAATLTAGAPTAAPTRPTVTPTFTPSPSPTTDPTEQAEQTIEAATQQAIVDLTKEAGLPTSTPGITAGDVEATGTALAAILLSPDVGGGEVTPTAEGALPGATAVPVGPQPTVVTSLPDTGIFDDIGNSGAAGITTLVLAAFGLLAVIFASRRLRANIDK